MQDLVLIGTGGFAREVHQVVEDMNQEKNTWNFLGFLDTDEAAHGTHIHNLPVLGGLEWLDKYPNTKIIFAVGNPTIKYKFFKKTAHTNIHFATLVHPQAWIGNRIIIGEGSIVCAGVRATTNIKIGKHVVLNLDCTIGHDAVISDYVTISPGANVSGSVTVYEGCDLGTNCTIIQGVSIGQWSIIGAGAVVVNNIPANVTAVGMPAKSIKERAEKWHEQALS